MGRRTLTTCVLAALLALAAGCGSDGDTPATRTAKTVAAPSPQLMATGEHVFAKHCQSCHTLLGKSHTGTTGHLGPNLDHVKPRPSYVRDRVISGGFEMQSFQSELSPLELRAIVAYVSTVSGRAIRDVGEPPALGSEVFAERCASCHGIAGAQASGTPDWPGTDFNLVKPSAPYAERMVREGWLEGRMPSFGRKLGDDEIAAVAAYVSSAAGRSVR
jgi:mono/diheme cytochrome c family protein